MLVDKFVMKWTADTQEAAASIDELQAKADKFAEKAGDKLGEEFKKAAKDIADAGEKLEAAAGSAGRVRGIFKDGKGDLFPRTGRKRRPHLGGGTGRQERRDSGNGQLSDL